MAKALAPLSSYPVSNGKVYDQGGNLMGDMDDYLGGVNDPARAQALRAESRAQGKYAPGPGAGGKERLKDRSSYKKAA